MSKNRGKQLKTTDQMTLEELLSSDRLEFNDHELIRKPTAVGENVVFETPDGGLRVLFIAPDYALMEFTVRATNPALRRVN